MFRTKFDAVDLDKSGFLELEEMSALASSFSGGEDDRATTEQLIEEADISGDKRISFAEFCSVMLQMQKRQLRTVREVFRLLDRDGSGVTTDEEMETLMKALGRKAFAKSAKSKIGMIDIAQLAVSHHVNPLYIDQIVVGEDSAAQGKLIKKLDPSTRGQLTFEQFARMVGYIGKVEELSDLDSDSDSVSSLSDDDTGIAKAKKHKKGVVTRPPTNPLMDLALKIDLPSNKTKCREFFLGDKFDVKIKPSSTASQLVEAIAQERNVEVSEVRIYIAGYEVDMEKEGGMKVTDLGYHSQLKPVFVVYNQRHSQLSRKEVFSDDSKPNLPVLLDHFRHEGLLERKAAMDIIKAATAIFKKQSTCKTVSGPATIIGDLHGQFFDLPEVLKAGGDFGTTQHIFLGDYVDRGYFSSEMVLYILAAQVRYPDKVTMLRGNHESRDQTAKIDSGTYLEVKDAYGSEVYSALMKCFDHMAPACVLEVSGKRFFCVHGGISPNFPTVESLKKHNRFNKDDGNMKGKLRGLHWADPSSSVKTDDPQPNTRVFDFKNAKNKGAAGPDSVYGEPNFKKSPRGSGIMQFNQKALDWFLRTNDILTVFRGHEQKPGFEAHPAGPSGLPGIVTVFSAPNYCDQSLAEGGVVVVGKSSFEVKTYNFKLHPVYTTARHATEPFRKHTLMEDFMLWLADKDESVLHKVSLTHLRSLPEARTFISIMNKNRGRAATLGDLADSTSDWEFLTIMLLEALKMAEDDKVLKYRQRAIKAARECKWDEGYSFIADSILREMANETADISREDFSFDI